MAVIPGRCGSVRRLICLALAVLVLMVGCLQGSEQGAETSGPDDAPPDAGEATNGSDNEEDGVLNRTQARAPAAEKEDGLTSFRAGEEGFWILRVSDPDGDLHRVVWALDGEEVAETSVSGGEDMAEASIIVNEPGMHTVVATVYDAGNRNETARWTVEARDPCWFHPDDREPSSDLPRAEPNGSLADLIQGRTLALAGVEEVRLLGLNETTDRLETRAQTDRPEHEIWDLELTSDGLYVLWEDRLDQRSTTSLDETRNRSLADAKGLGSDGRGRVFVATNGSLVAYDASLSHLGGVDTNVTGIGGDPKTAHDVHIEEGKAWLLDNVVVPMYLFRIDASQPDTMEIDFKHEVLGTGQHLAHHWIQPAEDRWYVVQQEGHREGRTQTLLTIDTKGGEQLREDGYWKWDRTCGHTQGTKVLALSDSSMPWGLVLQDDTLRLASVSAQAGNLSLDPVLELAEAPDDPPDIGDAGIARADDLLAIAAQGKLYLIDLEPQESDRPQLVHSQVIDVATGGIRTPLGIAPR